MPGTVEFYFDYGSPYSYIAHRRLPEIARRAEAAVVWRPMLLGGVFQLTGNTSPAFSKVKAAYSARELERFVAKYQVPFRRNPHFPVNTLRLMRGAVVAVEEGYLERYSDAAFAGMWRDGRKMDDDAVFAAALREAGLDDRRILARIAEEEVKQTLKAWTEAAVARGVFGAPTFFVGEEMFFGQDRLDFVEDALRGQAYRRAG
ncbi:MAG TPA: 2-hydroxychromene-2-carboxylate isomerase [Stellaceae bacterium]|nr:2-hydroxychromene-2-carboxylate isomerase [Stellaceae bacterium]